MTRRNKQEIVNGLNIFLEENGMFSKVNFISLKRAFLFLNLLSFYLKTLVNNSKLMLFCPKIYLSNSLRITVRIFFMCLYMKITKLNKGLIILNVFTLFLLSFPGHTVKSVIDQFPRA